MKLELVLLTILVGLITESQVEAQIDQCVCYEFRNRTGNSATYQVSPFDISKDFPRGPEACTLTGLWVFYDAFSSVNAMWADNEVYYPRARFLVRKILRIKRPYYSGPLSSVLFLVDIDGRGDPIRYFTGAATNLTHRFYGTVVYYGALVWTVESKPYRNSRPVQTCFRGDRYGRSLFAINTPVEGIVTSVTPRKCLGKEVVQRLRIPECPCNQGGVVDDANKCKGRNGICNCLKNNTGHDCYWCVPTHGIQKDGTCKELGLCGCDPRGVDNFDYSCNPPNSKNGKCNCHWHFTGDKCDRCDKNNFLLKDACHFCNCPWKKVNRTNNRCQDYTGICNCRPPYVGDSCERCAANYTALKALCLTTRQKPFVNVIDGYCKNNETDKAKVIKAIDDLKTEEIIDYVPYIRYWIRHGYTTPTKGACTVYQQLIT